MATNYPTSKQSFTNPIDSDYLNDPNHAGQHADINDTVEAIQDKLGITDAVISKCAGLKPDADATNAIQLQQSDGTNVLNIDTTNGRVGVNDANPDAKLDVIGDMFVGDDGTNYTEIKSDGEINLHGTAKVKKNIWIPADGIKAPGSKPASFVLHGLKGAWQFADAGAGNEETVSGSMKLPEEMDTTVAPSFYIGWSANGVSPGDCEWQFEYLYVGANSDTTAAAQETLTATSTASSTSDGLIIVEITGIDAPGGTDKAMFWKITRLSAGGNDTISDTVEMHGNFFEYTSDKLGEAL